MPKLDSLGLIFTLLPGLVALLVVRTLTAKDRKIEAVEAVLFGLAYTLPIHAIWTICKLLGSWVPTPDIVGLSITAVCFAFVVSWLVRTDCLFRLLRWLGITDQTVWVGTWNISFRKAKQERHDYAVFQLEDERRIMGEVRSFSVQQKEGHICLGNSRWIDKDNPDTPLLDGYVLIPAEKVESVQFLPDFTNEPQQEDESNSNE